MQFDEAHTRLLSYDSVSEEMTPIGAESIQRDMAQRMSKQTNTRLFADIVDIHLNLLYFYRLLYLPLFVY